jgi:hypothetical protein
VPPGSCHRGVNSDSSSRLVSTEHSSQIDHRIAKRTRALDLDPAHKATAFRGESRRLSNLSMRDWMVTRGSLRNIKGVPGRRGRRPAGRVAYRQVAYQGSASSRGDIGAVADFSLEGSSTGFRRLTQAAFLTREGLLTYGVRSVPEVPRQPTGSRLQLRGAGRGDPGTRHCRPRHQLEEDTIIDIGGEFARIA